MTSQKKIKPPTALFLLALSAAALTVPVSCQKNFSTNNRESSLMENISYSDATNGTEVFFLLRDQKLVKAQKDAPQGFYVVGTIETQRFVPSSEVLGIGDLATSGKEYGWLELSSQKFFPEHSGRRATTPFVKGYFGDGGFLPSSREVFNTP